MEQRVIKFRAWNITEGKWISGGSLDVDNAGVLYPTNSKDTSFSKISIMQFTGLHDRNGKEIWEGDVVKVTRRRKQYRGGYTTEELLLKVIWEEKSASFRFYYEKMKWSALFGVEDTYDVIGNIYENPSLLPLHNEKE